MPHGTRRRGISRRRLRVAPRSRCDRRQLGIVARFNADTTTLRDIALFLRCNDRFAEDTLTVRIRVRTPDSLQHEEPFVMVIPPAHTPAAISREADIPYRRRVLFDRTGDYHLTITPCRPVEGVEAVGIHIAKSQ